MSWNDGRLRVKLPQGTYIGKKHEDAGPHQVEAWYGIPYALPPTGDRRFRRPAKISPSESVFHATAYGPSAPGKPLLKVDGPPLQYSEDCLTANVFRRIASAESAALPVGVYIHGGAFNPGTASMHKTACMVANSDEPLLVVSFNYRLGALGFLPSAVTHDEGILNLGLHDQIHLLEWVQDHIHLFGGDPSCVTLFGLSAGAHSVSIIAYRTLPVYIASN